MVAFCTYCKDMALLCPYRDCKAQEEDMADVKYHRFYVGMGMNAGGGVTTNYHLKSDSMEEIRTWGKGVLEKHPGVHRIIILEAFRYIERTAPPIREVPAEYGKDEVTEILEDGVHNAMNP